MSPALHVHEKWLQIAIFLSKTKFLKDVHQALTLHPYAFKKPNKLINKINQICIFYRLQNVVQWRYLIAKNNVQWKCSKNFWFVLVLYSYLTRDRKLVSLRMRWMSTEECKLRQGFIKAFVKAPHIQTKYFSKELSKRDTEDRTNAKGSHLSLLLSHMGKKYTSFDLSKQLTSAIWRTI